MHSGVQWGCVLTDMAMLHPDFLTVFLDPTCHPCQQSPGDLLASGATVGAPCDGAEASQSPSVTPHPVLTLPFSSPSSKTPSWCVHLFTSSPFLLLFFPCRVPPHIPFSEPCVHLVLRLSFSFCPFSSALIYCGQTAAGVGSYDVWLQQLFLSALIWQSCCCP